MLDCCVVVFVTFAFFAKISFFFLSFSLNNTYPDLDNDLTLFWNRTARAAPQLHLLSGHAPHTVIHHLQLPCQTNNSDCGIFVLAYQRAVKTWINTHLSTNASTR